MKLAIAIIRSIYKAGSQASISIVTEDQALVRLRTITGDADEMDVRLFEVPDEAQTCNFEDGFISNDGTLEVKRLQPVHYKYLCNLTKLHPEL